MTAVVARLQILKSVHGESDADVSANEDSWRRSLRTITQLIVEPDDLTWMDDDESTSDTQYISRALSDIENRLAR